MAPAVCTEFNVNSKSIDCIMGNGVVVLVEVVNLNSSKRVLSESIISPELLSIAAAKSLQKMEQKLKQTIWLCNSCGGIDGMYKKIYAKNGKPDGSTLSYSV